MNKNDTDKHFDSYINILNKEISFLMEVFKQSSDRQIDLTPAMFLSLDVVQQSIYSIMKHKLNTGSRVVTRTNVAKSYSQWIYPVSRELMRFSLPAESKTSDTSHIFIGVSFICLLVLCNCCADFERRTSGGHTLLTKAVQYRSVLFFISDDET